MSFPPFSDLPNISNSLNLFFFFFGAFSRTSYALFILLCFIFLMHFNGSQTELSYEGMSLFLLPYYFS